MGMPNRVKAFPRGYSGGQSDTPDKHETRTGDTEVNKLWEKYTSPVNNSTTWAFRRQVLACAKRLLGSHRNWFVAQERNALVTQYNYQFVLDTLRYIGTGRRRISIHAWSDLLINYPVGGLDDVSERHEIADLFERLNLQTSTVAMLQLWSQHPGGIDDMLCTLNLLFGDLPLKKDPTRH